MNKLLVCVVMDFFFFWDVSNLLVRIIIGSGQEWRVGVITCSGNGAGTEAHNNFRDRGREWWVKSIPDLLCPHRKVGNPTHMVTQTLVVLSSTAK